MSESNIKGLWNIMKSITGYGTQLGGDGINVDEANQFFARFDLFAYHRSILASLALSSSEDWSPVSLINVEEVPPYLVLLFSKFQIWDSKHFILPLNSPQHGEGESAPRAILTMLTEKSADRTSSAHQWGKRSFGLNTSVTTLLVRITNKCKHNTRTLLSCLKLLFPIINVWSQLLIQCFLFFMHTFPAVFFFHFNLKN